MCVGRGHLKVYCLVVLELMAAYPGWPEQHKKNWRPNTATQYSTHSLMTAKVRAESSCSSVFGDIERSRFFKLWPLLTFEQVVGSRRYMSSKLNNANRLKKSASELISPLSTLYWKDNFVKLRNWRFTQRSCALNFKESQSKEMFFVGLWIEKNPPTFIVCQQ